MDEVDSTARHDTASCLGARKLQPWEFFRDVLRSSKLIVAPMVDQSEYAWRLLSRRHGAQLCYTPMFHARLFAENATYRADHFLTDAKEDRPLIVQFCANDPEWLLKAAKLVEGECDAVDINLGCPQAIAKRGHYGAFLMEEWELIERMVKKLSSELSIPVTCKIRVFPEVEKTLHYAKMIEAAGCSMLVVHGRLREQKGHKTGLADWEQIRRVKAELSIPVIANGNILYREDLDRCIEQTGVDGVMTAEGNLYNPLLFEDVHLPVWEVAEEYLAIAKGTRDANTSVVRAHIFKLFKPLLPSHPDLRTALAGSSMEGIEDITRQLRERVIAAVGAENVYVRPPYEKNEKGLRILPGWVCQPDIRQELIPNKRKMEQPMEQLTGDDGAKEDEVVVVGPKADLERGEAVNDPSQSNEPVATPPPSNKRARERKDSGESSKPKRAKRVTCTMCPNVPGAKCVFALCKACCVKSGKDLYKERGNGVADEEGDYVCESHKVLKEGRSKPARRKEEVISPQESITA
ncbi:tRNA-dihydrouridine synthase 1 [Cladochytrium replicatum]|nr:tRNA-dihydrouridine synthase 1 [Cladochytrium replicatum]